jgi:hypothetical protein
MEAPARIAAAYLGKLEIYQFYRNQKRNNCSYLCSWGDWKKRDMAKLEYVTNTTIVLLGETGQIAASQNFEDAVFNVELLLQEIGTGSIEKNLKETADSSVRLLEDMGKMQISKDLKELYSRQLIRLRLLNLIQETVAL